MNRTSRSFVLTTYPSAHDFHRRGERYAIPFSFHHSSTTAANSYQVLLLSNGKLIADSVQNPGVVA
jgi:hypothetical protein